MSYLAQTNGIVKTDNVLHDVYGNEVYLVYYENEPLKNYFVFKNAYDNIGRDCSVFRAKKNGNKVKKFYN